MIGYVRLLNSYYLYLVLETFILERITDTAGHKIPIPWLSVAIIVVDCLLLSVATLGFYKTSSYLSFKKNDIDKELLMKNESRSSTPLSNLYYRGIALFSLNQQKKKTLEEKMRIEQDRVVKFLVKNYDLADGKRRE